jgi:peptidoglycan/xylan/chitin deacetylase (PgdA/CDA1 family)
MWILIAIGAGIVLLAHSAPAPFLLEALNSRRSAWHMPQSDPPTIYLTFDDGPNPTTTPICWRCWRASAFKRRSF